MPEMIEKLISAALSWSGSDWRLWVGLTVMVAVGTSALVTYEVVRRKTYESILGAAGPGTILIDEKRGQRMLVLVRGVDSVGAPRCPACDVSAYSRVGRSR